MSLLLHAAVVGAGVAHVVPAPSRERTLKPLTVAWASSLGSVALEATPVPEPVETPAELHDPAPMPEPDPRLPPVEVVASPREEVPPAEPATEPRERARPPVFVAYEGQLALRPEPMPPAPKIDLARSEPPAPLNAPKPPPRAATRAEPTTLPAKPAPAVNGLAQARAGECPPPAYPSRAFRLGWEGEVEVRVHISAEGRPLRAEVVKPSQYSILDDAAIDAVLTWRFLPEVRDGHPIASSLIIPFEFRILDAR